MNDAAFAAAYRLHVIKSIDYMLMTTVLVPHVHLDAFSEEGLDRDHVAVAAREVQRGWVVSGLDCHLGRHAFYDAPVAGWSVIAGPTLCCRIRLILTNST